MKFSECLCWILIAVLVWKMFGEGFDPGSPAEDKCIERINNIELNAACSDGHPCGVITSSGIAPFDNPTQDDKCTTLSTMCGNEGLILRDVFGTGAAFAIFGGSPDATSCENQLEIQQDDTRACENLLTHGYSCDESIPYGYCDEMCGRCTTMFKDCGACNLAAVTDHFSSSRRGWMDECPGHNFRNLAGCHKGKRPPRQITTDGPPTPDTISESPAGSQHDQACFWFNAFAGVTYIISLELDSAEAGGQPLTSPVLTLSHFGGTTITDTTITETDSNLQLIWTAQNIERVMVIVKGWSRGNFGDFTISVRESAGTGKGH